MTETDRPLLSICMPTYNRAEILRQTLAYLVEVLDPAFEIVVSNNCSNDHTIDILKDFKEKWERFRYVTQTKEVDLKENWTVSLLMARGKYCHILHDGDRIIIEGLLAAIKLMEEQEDIVGVFGGYMEWDPKTNETELLTQVEKMEIFPKGSKWIS